MNLFPLCQPWLLALLLMAGSITTARSAERVLLIQRAERPGGLNAFLDLPPPRAARLKELQERVARENRRLEGSLQERREELEAVYRSYHFDEERCRQLQRVIRERQDQLLALHHQFQLELRSILTEPEFALLQQKLQEARERARAGVEFRRSPERRLEDPKRGAGAAPEPPEAR